MIENVLIAFIIIHSPRVFAVLSLNSCSNNNLRAEAQFIFFPLFLNRCSTQISMTNYLLYYGIILVSNL